MLVISCPDGIAADTVFAPTRGQRLCVCLRVRVCVCVHTSRCGDCVSKCVLWGKMQDDSKGEERGNRCGGILRASGDTHTHTHTHTRALPISSGLLCSHDRRDTYCIFVCVFLCARLGDKYKPFRKLLTVLTCTV